MPEQIKGDRERVKQISVGAEGTTPRSYDRTTIGLHWATACLVALLWLMGRTTNFLPRGPLRLDIWSLHVVLGFVLAAIVLGRIIWRTTRGYRLPPSDRGVRHLLAMTTHVLLYVLLLIVVTLGVLNVFAHGFPLFDIWHFPKVGSGRFGAFINHWHDVVANIIAILAVFHATAALVHRYIIGDDVLHRMHPSSFANPGLNSVIDAKARNER